MASERITGRTKMMQLAIAYAEGDPKARRKVQKLGGINALIGKQSEKAWNRLFNQIAITEINKVIRENS
jgi:hypothetical protein